MLSFLARLPDRSADAPFRVFRKLSFELPHPLI